MGRKTLTSLAISSTGNCIDLHFRGYNCLRFRYLFSMRIEGKEGEEPKVPKMGYALKIRSFIKTKIRSLFHVDVTDPCLFPESEKRWKAVLKNIVREKRGDVEHHKEVDPTTMLKIYKLAGHLKKAIEGRGSADYVNLLGKIDPTLHNSIHTLVQDIAMMILETYEVRRGRENMENLEVTDFQVFDDNIYEFRYIRKTISEPEKQNPLGTNPRCAGVIPFIEMANGFNPAEFFEFYMNLLPKEPNKSKNKVFLFPMARKPSNKFSIHNPAHKLYEANMKGGTS